MGQSQSQGQQGLFPAAPYMTPAARYPRGYTPERMAEVRKGLTRTVTTEGDLIPGTDVHKLNVSHESIVKPEAGLEEAGMMPGGVKSVHARHERAINEAIARSTVPRFHLHSLQSIEVDNERLSKMGAAGFYEIHKRPLMETNRIVVQPMSSGDSRGKAAGKKRLGRNAFAETSHVNQVKQDTLIHEIGHHVSFHNNRRNLARADFPRETTASGTVISGPEEAYADDFAVTQRRQDPRDVRQNGQRIKGMRGKQPTPSHTYLSTGNLTHKNTSYVEARQHWGDEGERQLSLDDDGLHALRDARVEKLTREHRRDGIQEDLPDVTYQAVVNNPHLEFRPGPRPAGLQANSLNGRQFGGT